MRHVSLVVALALILPGCGSDPAPTDAAVDARASDAAMAADAFVPSTALVSAAAGGSVRSPDGVFTLVVPPGALAADTSISISIMPHTGWPAEVAATGPVGEVYDVQPEGLAFLVPAYGVHHFDALPPALRSPEGDTYFATHRARSADGTITPMETRTYVRTDGVFVVATLPHLSEQWFSSTLPSGAVLNTHLVAEAGEHTVGTSWNATAVNLTSLHAIPGLSYRAVAEVRTLAAPSPFVVPLMPPGWMHGVEVVHYGPLIGPTYETSRSPTITATLPELMPTAASNPMPGWRCAAVGGPDQALISARVGVTEGTSPEISLSLDVGYVTCVAGAAGPTGEIFLAENTRLTRSGGSFTLGGVGALANVISETPDLQTHCRRLGTSSTTARICTNVVTFSSAVGASPITMSSSLQHVTATYAGTGYGISGATGSAVYAPVDTMHVSGMRPGTTMPYVIDVSAPARLPAPALFLGPPAGLRTQLRVPDGTVGDFYVSVGLTGPGGGESFLTRSVPIADAELSGTDRLIQMLEDDMIDDLFDAAFEASEVYVGVVHQTNDPQFFEAATTAIRAGRFYQVSGADLGTTTHGTGTDVDCFTGLPVTIGGAGVVSGSDAIVATMCRSMTTCRLVSGNTCPPGTSTFASFGWDVASSAPIVTGERIDLATHGDLPMRGRLTGIPRSSDERTEVGMGTVGYAIDYRIEGTDFAFARIAGGGLLSPTGAQCAGLPAHWIVRLDPNTTRASAAGNVCSNSSGTMCSVASPGMPCSAPTSTFAVRFSAAGVPEVAATSPWSFASSSHGTFAADVITGLPRGVDITIASLRDTGLHGSTVVRFDGTNVQILSASLTP